MQKCDLSPRGTFSWIDHLVIDFAKLAKIPQEDRLRFRLSGSAVVWLWHEDIVQVIEASGATGIGFSLAEGYRQDSVFNS